MFLSVDQCLSLCNVNNDAFGMLDSRGDTDPYFFVFRNQISKIVNHCKDKQCNIFYLLLKSQQFEVIYATLLQIY